MLLRAVVLKSVLSSVPSDSRAQQLFCGSVIGILKDLADNCVVLVDDQNLITGALFEAARTWPIKFRPYVLKLLTLLRTRHRFVKLRAESYGLTAGCAELTCKHSIGIANALQPTGVIAAEPCVCSEANLINAPVLTVEDYSTSPFHDSLVKSRVYQLKRGQWDQRDFEENVLVPLFLYAKSVMIYDKYIAQSIDTRGHNGRVLASTQLKDRFRRTLEWIIHVCVTTSVEPVKQLEVYTAVDAGKDNNEIAIILAALKTFEADVRTKYKIPSFTVIAKEETRQSRMPHGRYLLTDQLGVLIECGFDLLLDDGAMPELKRDPARDLRRIRDCVVAHCPDATRARALQDLT